MRLYLAFALAGLAIAGGGVRAEDAARRLEALATDEASESGEGSLCLGYDPKLTTDELGKALAEVATINAKIVSIEGEAGIATLYFVEAEPQSLVALQVEPADQLEYGLHRCAAAGTFRQAGLLAVFAGGALVGVLLGDDDDEGPAADGAGVPVGTPGPASGPGSPTGQPPGQSGTSPGQPPGPPGTPPGQPPGPPATPPGQPPGPPGRTPTPLRTSTPGSTPTPVRTGTPGPTSTPVRTPTPGSTSTPQLPTPTSPPPTATPRPPSPMR